MADGPELSGTVPAYAPSWGDVLDIYEAAGMPKSSLSDLTPEFVQLTSAEVIAALVEMSREAAAESQRGSHFKPALTNDELAFYDAVAQNESAVDLQGVGKLADIARGWCR